MGTPNSDNIFCGSGVVYFNRKNLDGTYAGYRHLGNVSKLDLTPTITTIEKNSAMTASRATIAQAVTATKMECAMTLDEFEQNNVALALLGDAAAYAQSSGTKTAATLGNANPGYALDTGIQNVVVTDVKKGVTVLTLGVDYTVDSAAGLIMILVGGQCAQGDALTWDGSAPAIASNIVHALSNGKIEGMLRFVSSADQIGPKMNVDIFKLFLSPDTAIALLGTTFAEINVKGECLADTTRPVGQQFAQVVYLP